VMNADGSAQTRLTTNAANECCLVWSPDSTQLAFVSDRDGNYEIYVMNVQSGAVARITNNAAYDAPLAWRP
jgi:Tol biopolymer transport system component